jgi:peptidoglycan/xylan/chitin deacetylase (PgdA/CDA1 family)
MTTRQKIILSVCIAILGTALSCSGPPEPKMYLVINFDTEDYISPESEGIDDIPKWLAEIMTEEGITGTFFVIGEKARSLERRGRRDVIAAMARHDIGSHTNRGSIHPTVTEQLETADWDAGLALMYEQESAGIRELERIFGVPVTSLARHGGSYGPQLVAALGRMNAGYSGSPVSLPGKNVVWFCNALNFSGQVNSLDDTYFKDDLFEARFTEIKKELPELAEKVEAISFFAGHPCKIRTEQFWDLNFYYGENREPEEWEIPEMRPRETMATARKNFRRLMRWLKSRNDIEITTFRELMMLYSHQKDTITRDDLLEMADSTMKRNSILPGEYFSPAEAFHGLARSLLEYPANGSLPASLKIDTRPFGPMDMPVSRPEASRVDLEEVYGLAKAADDSISGNGVLPTFLGVGGRRIGTGSLYALFCEVFLDLHAGTPAGEYPVPSFDPYPRTNEDDIVRRVNGSKGWPVHRRDLDMSNIAEMTKLQLWTLKPAHRCAEK